MSEYKLNNETGTFDSNGNKCDWYDQYAYDESFWVGDGDYFYWNCGSFDTPDFKAEEQCGACRGGISYRFTCESLDGNDAEDNNCRDRNYQPYNGGPYCGVTDSNTFKASEQCCLCGGGDRTWNDPWDNEWNPITGPYRYANACVETGYFGDAKGESCSYYAKDDRTKANCGLYDTPHFNLPNTVLIF